MHILMYNSPTRKPARAERRSKTDAKPKIFSRKKMTSCHFGGWKQVTTISHMVASLNLKENYLRGK